MELNILNYTFVGILNNPFTSLPNFDESSLINLLELPYETQIAKDHNGIAIQARNRYVGAILNKDRFVVTAESPEMLNRIITRVVRELKKTHLMIAISAYGLNYEIEYIKLPDVSTKWLWENFMSNVAVNNTFHECNKVDFRLGIAANQYFNFSFEPRVNNPHAVFLNLNHHHQCFNPLEISSIDIINDIEKSLTLYHDEYELNIISNYNE